MAAREIAKLVFSVLKGLVVGGLLMAWAVHSAKAAGPGIFWTNSGVNTTGTTIGSANLDGSGVNQSFISGGSYLAGVAISGNYVYWANGTNIGRANLDGSGANPSFITGAFSPDGVAADGNYIYWANSGPGNASIGRANLDGTGVNQSFITTGSTPGSVVVDEKYIYWTDPYANTIARSNLDGTGVNESFHQ